MPEHENVDERIIALIQEADDLLAAEQAKSPSHERQGSLAAIRTMLYMPLKAADVLRKNPK